MSRYARHDTKTFMKKEEMQTTFPSPENPIFGGGQGGGIPPDAVDI